MANRKYYVLCESNCKFEGMTKEQTLTAIAQAVETGEIKEIDSGFITTLKEQNSGNGLKMWVGTQAEYNALQEIEENCFYIIADDTTEADFAEVLKNQNEQIAGMQDFINAALVTRDESDQVTMTRGSAKLFVQGNIVQLSITLTFPDAGDYYRDHKINIGTLKKYAPLCPISMAGSGYGNTYNNSPSTAEGRIMPNDDGTATVYAEGKYSPTGTVYLTATWLI